MKLFLKPLRELGLLLKEIICSQREQILTFKSSPYMMKEKMYFVQGDPSVVEIVSLRTCVVHVCVNSASTMPSQEI